MAMPEKRCLATKAELLPAPSIASEADRLETLARRVLEEERQSLMAKIREQESQLAQEPLVTGNDVGDSAAKMDRQGKTIAMLRFWKAHLSEVKRAINRLDDGTYGLCERCGYPIPAERLQAFPTAALCIHCARLQAQNIKLVV
jgi:DnaK suppressor protein